MQNIFYKERYHLKTIGERIKHLRVQAKLKQVDVANKTGISTSNISRIEKNEINPSADTILQICNLFSVSSDWLLMGNELKYKPNKKTATEELLLENFRDMNQEQQRQLVNHSARILATEYVSDNKKVSIVNQPKNTPNKSTSKWHIVYYENSFHNYARSVLS